MTVTINGSGTMTGLAVGGLNDNIITPAELSTGAPSWDSSGNLSFNSGYGSVATAYGCRAWVNFNGTGTVTIRASGNVSSITDNGVGNYIANFATAMPDVNYSLVVSGGSNQTANYYSGSVAARVIQPGVTATTSANVFTGYQYTGGSSLEDWGYVYLAVFR